MKNRLPHKNNWRALLCTCLITLALVAATCTTANSTTNSSTTPNTAATSIALSVINGATTTNYTLAQLQAMPSATGYGSKRSGAGVISGPYNCVGVALTNIIKAAGGMPSGSEVKITASDGYAKTLSYAQIYQGNFNTYDTTGAPSAAGSQPYVSLVYSVNGSALDATTGPIETAIITGIDRVSDASLWIKMVSKIEILQPVSINVSGAASLSNVLKAINSAYISANPNVSIIANFASSGTLQTQIENGAPCDVFISAALAQMDNLQKESLIITSTRKNLLYNNLVMIVPNGRTLGLTSFTDTSLSKVTKIAIGDPKSVPAGTYAQKAFDELGITSRISSKFILGADVTTVLNYVATGNVDCGFVYSTDALSSTAVKVVAQAPADINALIVYPAALIANTRNQTAAQNYLNFLFSDSAKVLFQQYGFTLATN